MIYILFIVFVLLTLLIKFCSAITLCEHNIILFVQNMLHSLPLWIPELPDKKLYIIMICLPLVICGIVLAKKKYYVQITCLYSIPLISFLINIIIKNIVQRPRPSYELQLLIHPNSFSFVSSHSLVTFALYGFVILLLCKYVDNKLLKNIGIVISVLWILFVGISRIWLGVHYPTDVLSAYILGGIFILLNTKILEFWNNDAEQE